MNAQIAQAQGAKRKVFDWDKAAKIIAKKMPKEASAGLSNDWEWTGGTIFSDGRPVPKKETYVYLASIWATPELNINGKIIECWKYQDETPNWNADTYWPDSALEILNQ